MLLPHISTVCTHISTRMAIIHITTLRTAFLKFRSIPAQVLQVLLQSPQSQHHLE